jgi:hypothetical protein
MKDDSSETFRTTRSSMLKETEIQKEMMFLSGRDMEVQTKDGALPMLIEPEKKELRDLTETTDSILVESSTSDQDFQ